MNINSVITGHGSYLPNKIITNYDLEKIVDTNHDWIVERTGIYQRHIAENESNLDMAYQAALAAIKNANIDKDQIDLIIVATTTADNSFPSTASKLQGALGIKSGAAFDIQAVCAGFIYGINIADSFIKTKQATNILLVGVDKMSSLLDWSDRGTCVLFGDGAGAVVISAKESDDKIGIIASKIHADGSLHDALYTNGGISSTKTAGTIKMNGKEVFKHAVEKMSSTIRDLFISNNMDLSQIDIFVPHQANLRILEALTKKLDLPKEKIICTLDKHANTSAASIPLALDYALSNNRIKAGDIVALTAIGAGLCWGSAIIRW
jgi:3-oxoacyl-[acyl-carrier-protein] synthase-3